MKNIFFVTIISFCSIQIYSQVTPPIHCTSADTICSSVILLDTLKVAIDSTADEISSNSCLTYGEIRGTWYKFGINDTGYLRFNITPFDTLADFDWSLFRVDWGDCTNIFSVPSYEVSCNVSGVGGGFYTTGADGLIQQGHNPAVYITTPAVFYLYITTSLQDTGAVLGYTIDFTASDFSLVPCNEIGIEEQGMLDAKIYPNPVEDMLNIRLSNHFGNSIINLFDMSGRNLLYYKTITDNYSIDVSNLVQGVYVLEIQSDKGILRKKIIKN